MPCVGTHVFMWGDSPGDQGPPEGQSCKCGMFEVHYESCSCGCGSRIMSLCFKRGEPALGSQQESKFEL